MEPEIITDEEGNTWEVNRNELDPNGNPLITPYLTQK